MKLYIAYGSNMSEEQMAYRCSNARFIGKSEIKNYELKFKGSRSGAYATIEPAKGKTVPVVVWEISEADEQRLDIYEGYPHFYYKKELKVPIKRGMKTAMVYIMDERRPIGVPSNNYYNVMKAAYKKFGFDNLILKQAYANSLEQALNNFSL